MLQFNKLYDGSHLERIAVAFALARCKLSLLYRSDSTIDFGLPDMMARREASILNEENRRISVSVLGV